MVPEYVTSSPRLLPWLTPDRTRSGLRSFRMWLIGQKHAVGRRAVHRELALAHLAHPQRPMQRQRMAGSRLLRLRRHDPDIVGQGAGDLLQHFQPWRMDSIIIRQQDSRF